MVFNGAVAPNVIVDIYIILTDATLAALAIIKSLIHENRVAVIDLHCLNGERQAPG
jgi:hypothetical protein